MIYESQMDNKTPRVCAYGNNKSVSHEAIQRSKYFSYHKNIICHSS